MSNNEAKYEALIAGFCLTRELQAINLRIYNDSKLVVNQVIKAKVRILRLKASRYVLYDDKLYRRGYLMLLLKCIPPTVAEYIIREIHEGICGNHAEG